MKHINKIKLNMNIYIIYRHNDLYIYAQFQINRQIIQKIWSFIYTTPNSKELSENGRVVLFCLEVGLTF